MSETALHTVDIKGDEGIPRIEFTCHGGRDALCHRYPDCECADWEEDHWHPSIAHDKCWMQDWFDNDGIDPMPENLAECEYASGMSGPIKTYFYNDYVEWEFIPAKPSEESL